MSTTPFQLNAPGLAHDPDWFRKAVFYEVLVRAFSDANGDGSGDFSGLIDKLDYLQWLGIDCLWLPPFYESPLRDGGYGGHVSIECFIWQDIAAEGRDALAVLRAADPATAA